MLTPIPFCIIVPVQDAYNREISIPEKVFLLSTYERLSIKLFLSIAGIIGPLIFIATDISLGLTVPGYNFIKDSISSLAWAPLGWLQTLKFMAMGLLLELFVAGLFLSVRRQRGFGLGIIILMLFGFGLLLIGAFHTNPSPDVSTIEGVIHAYAAKFIFWFFPLAALLISPSLRKDPYWRPLFFYTIGAAIFSVALMISSIPFPTDSGWFGLFERILVADVIIWVLFMAVWLLRQAVMQRKKLFSSRIFSLRQERHLTG